MVINFILNRVFAGKRKIVFGYSIDQKTDDKEITSFRPASALTAFSEVSQSAFTSSRSSMEAPDQCMKSVQS